ncbi:MAG TPA: fluoride efflux transporter CrcB [Pseudomonadota bacterium]|jgi:CrcB protein|nr:fluoride efflux transporter CrcB [Pseudomonadota bacterium]HNF98780.1 fluoride efflux transporter CrcB [Pseudomonadota bacterium]HNI61123.1 fluoride efflux transporter CrcB [Pseudomonadota bacterium]HNN53731.1 fluoride efflux transporter CrcB [Pseudomonadota bacterium]
MLAFVLVTLGSAVGGLLRYGTAVLINPRIPVAWPLATLLVNVLGCFVLSLVNQTVLRGVPIRPSLRLFLTTGLCGGFTTYSTFNYETVSLVEQRGFLSGVGYAVSTVVLCLGAHFLASLVAKTLHPA